MNEELKDEDIRKYLFRRGMIETSGPESMEIVKRLTAPMVEYVNKNDNLSHGYFICQMILDTVEKMFMEQLVTKFKKINADNFKKESKEN